MSALKFLDVCKQYGRQAILKNINLEIEEGQFFAILGEEGAGKTTLVKLVMRMLYPKAGDIYLFDQSIRKGICKVKKRIGFVPEDILYYENITAETYLRGCMAFYKMDAAEEMERLCALFELDIHQPLLSMTYEDNKITAVIGALLHNPALILLDEPECVLSEEAEEKLIKELKNRCAGGTTVLWTCEDVEYIKLICNKVAFMDKGEITKIVNMSEFVQEKIITIINGESECLKAAGAEMIFQDMDRSVHTYKGSAKVLGKAILDSGCSDYTLENASLYEQEFKYYERWHYLCR